MNLGKLALVAILFVAGLYFALDHRPPLPFNHEVVGLGANHLMHTVFGIVLLAIIGVIWFMNMKKK